MAYLQLVVDDNSLEDAELWDLIDSAASRRGHFKQNQPQRLSPPRKPLLLTSVQDTELPPSPPAFNEAVDSRRAALKNQKRYPPQYMIRASYDAPQCDTKQRPWIHPQKLARRDEQAAISDCFERNGSNPQRSNLQGRLPLHDNGSIFSASHELVERPIASNAWGDVKENRMFSGMGVIEKEWMGGIPSASVFKHFQTAAMAVLEKGDYTLMQGKPVIKKSGWRKIAFFFNISFEIKDKNIEFDQNKNVIRAEFIVRATMQSGRYTDSWGSCDRGEKRFSKPNHDIPGTAETRAKTRACQDLLGIGDYKNSGW